MRERTVTSDSLEKINWVSEKQARLYSTTDQRDKASSSTAHSYEAKLISNSRRPTPLLMKTSYRKIALRDYELVKPYWRRTKKEQCHRSARMTSSNRKNNPEPNLLLEVCLLSKKARMTPPHMNCSDKRSLRPTPFSDKRIIRYWVSHQQAPRKMTHFIISPVPLF